MATILFKGVVAQTVLGLIGTYIGRVFREGKRRSLYLIDKKLTDSKF